MSFKTHLIKTIGLGAIIMALTAGTALAAVAVSTANVRSGPSTGYHVVDVLHGGEYVTITGRSGDWCRVDKPGPNGYVACYLLTGGRSDFYDGPRVFIPRYDGFDRHHRHYDYFNRGPSFGLSVGPGGVGFGVDVGPRRGWY